MAYRFKIRKNTRARAFNGPFSGTTQVSRYQKGKTNLDFTEARDSEWQRHQLGHMQFCISLQADNHASNPSLTFLQAGCPSCRPTNSVKALKERKFVKIHEFYQFLKFVKNSFLHVLMNAVLNFDFVSFKFAFCV